ncbi:hypothetical protein A2892_01575 [Candidatus Woesebacteria bacterium RIFCSPLOWO2_01_FULL_39_10b]|uniref:ROK family protein n=1 Tax=Candidatus Woesebacteria bacterium RIFCSPLOWO2_01_FULL_39_10b TaxID=1802517 RepID=A0A1F8B9I9_9BACT|nr:MAG: hypothetical protein A2892_01575 [Candidatus Woesebacteria bacterium RIFCSPLOWO2_01_FULL_39_10b]
MFLLFDIGGTKMRLAVSKDCKEILSFQVFDTPLGFKEAIKIIANYWQKVGSNAKLTAVVGGVAGVFNKEKTRLFKSPNLPEWEGEPLKEGLEKLLESKVYLENDTALAGLAEAVKGSGKGYSINAYITIGTGVGGVRIVNQKIDKNIFGFEPGHQIIDADSSITGKFLDLEGLVGGSGIKKRFGKNPEEINDEKIWNEITKLLAIGLANTILHWSPGVVILGGGIIQSEKVSWEKLKNYLQEYLKIFPRVPEIKKSLLGDKGGLEGALVYLNEFRQTI